MLTSDASSMHQLGDDDDPQESLRHLGRPPKQSPSIGEEVRSSERERSDGGSTLRDGVVVANREKKVWIAPKKQQS